MTPKQSELVRATFPTVHNMREIAVTTFYRRLFELEPELRLHFEEDARFQGRALIAALAAAMEKLDNPSDMARDIRSLGKEHILHRIPRKHHGAIRSALLGTLEDRLGKLFTAEVRDAWHAASLLIENAVLSGCAARSASSEA